MLKKEYLKFHSKHIWETANSNGFDLLHSIYSPYDKFIEAKEIPYLLNNNIKIKSEEELFKILQNKSFFIRNNNNQELFLKNILVNCSNDELSYFIKNHIYLIGDIKFKSLLNIIKILPNDKIENILKHSTNIGSLDIDLLEDLIKKILPIPNADEILIHYLLKNKEEYNTEVYQNRVKNIILKYFSNSLKNFKKLPFINLYLEEQNKPLFYNHIQETIFVCLNLQTLQEQFNISDYLLKDYQDLLKKLMDYVSVPELNLNIFNVDVVNIEYIKYSYTNVYINLEKNDLKLKLNSQMVEMMILDFFSFLKSQNLNSFNVKMKSEKMIEKWVSSYIFAIKLDTNLLNKEIKEKRNKL